MAARGSRGAPAPQVGTPVPRVPDTLVPRAHLYAVLDRATTAPLTLLIAPAGTGKTVLVSAWSRRGTGTEPARDVTWLAAHDHARLNETIITAVGRRPVDTSDRAVLAAITRTRVDDRPPPVVVIDDAHLLKRHQVRLIGRILTTTTDGPAFVLASRRDLALPVVDLALHGQATTLRGAQLRLTDAETALLVRAHAGDVSPRQIAAVQDRTDGWAAAVVLAARTLVADPEGDGDGDRDGLSLSRTDQPILDVLLGDAFATLSEPTREILLSTFGEGTVTSARAVTLSGRPDAGAILDDLAAAGMLVTAHAEQVGTDVVYRYHPLLIELLRRRTVGTHDDSAAVSAAHRRAALHAAELAQPRAALTHARASGDPDLIVRVLRDLGLVQLCTGEPQVVRDVLDALPRTVLDEHPELTGLTGLAHRDLGDPIGAGRQARRASDVLALAEADPAGSRIEPDDLVRLAYDAASLDLWQGRFGWQDAAAAIRTARRLLGCTTGTVSRHRHRPPAGAGPDRQSWLLTELATTELWAGDLARAQVHLDQALVGARMLGPNRLPSTILSQLALIQYLGGGLVTAGETAELALAQRGGADPVTTARAHVVLGLAAYERLDLEAARQWLGLVRSYDEGPDAAGDPIVTTLGVLLRALLLTEEGDLDAARRALVVEPVAAGGLPTFLLQYVAMVRWLCALLAGDDAAIAAQVRLLQDLGAAHDVDAMRAIADARARRDGAVDSLRTVLDSDEPLHPAIRAATRAVYVALLVRAGDRVRARDELDDLLAEVAIQSSLHALTIAASDRGFLDLLRDATHRSGAHPFASTAYAALDHHRVAMPGSRMHSALGAGRSPRPHTRAPLSAGDPPPRRGADGVPHPRAGAGPQNPTIEVRITTRESEVLEQLALGGSYAEIGDALFITENTVKTHLASLYRKLGVEKRSAALRVARDRNLI